MGMGTSTATASQSAYFDIVLNSSTNDSLAYTGVYNTEEIMIYYGRALVGGTLENSNNMTIHMYCDQFNSKYNVYSAPGYLELYVRGINIYY